MLIPENMQVAIRNGEEAETSVLKTYISEGGTYLIATPAMWNDDGKPKDLIAIGRYGEVVSLSFTVNPDLIELVKELVK